MIDNKSEYTALRNELVATINIQITMITVMYTATFVALGIAINNKNAYLCLLPYLILFPFQGSINNKRGAMMKIGAYINVFHEDGGQWESVYPEFNKRWKMIAPKRRVRMSFLTKTSASQLGIVSSALSIYYYFTSVTVESNCNLFFNIGFVVVVLVMASILFLINRPAFQNDVTMQKYIEIMKEIKSGQIKKIN